MQGLFINGRRPKSKKEVKELVTSRFAPRVAVEATSLFGNEFEGPITDAPVGTTISFVGPDPYTSRKFYGTIKVTESGIKVS